MKPEQAMFQKVKKLHFVGIGGTGMCGIAEVLLTMGYSVSGSDQKDSPVLEHLRSMGGVVYVGHRAEQVNDAQAVVVSNAVPMDNVEVAEAKAKKIPVIPRAEMLSELMRIKYGIAISGTHGKTTTTSMVSTILFEAGFDPTFVIGGKLNSMGKHGHVGQGPHLVVEADEAFGSFLHLNPSLAVVTNIDNDHLDFYKDMDSLKKAFLTFINRVPFYSCAILCDDDPVVKSLYPSVTRRVVTYGLGNQCQLKAKNITLCQGRTTFEVIYQDKKLGEASILVHGEHNVRNALAATGVGLEMDIPFEKISKGLASFTGVERRFQTKGEKKGVWVVDDYAHHPSEISATLKAAKALAKGRVIAIFQPHLFSRTKLLHWAFAEALQEADVVYLTDIYPARELPQPGVTTGLIVDDLKTLNKQNVNFIPDRAKVASTVAQQVKAGDLVLTMGAGNIWQTGEEILQCLGA